MHFLDRPRPLTRVGYLEPMFVLGVDRDLAEVVLVFNNPLSVFARLSHHITGTSIIRFRIVLHSAAASNNHQHQRCSPDTCTMKTTVDGTCTHCPILVTTALAKTISHGVATNRFTLPLNWSSRHLRPQTVGPTVAAIGRHLNVKNGRVIRVLQTTTTCRRTLRCLLPRKHHLVCSNSR